MAEKLKEYWQAFWSPKDMAPTWNTAQELPGTFPSNDQESEAGSHTLIYELPVPATDRTSEPNAGLSNLIAPFHDGLPEFGLVPLQEQGDRESGVDTKVSDRSSATPKRGDTSVFETSKSSKTLVKDSSSLKLRKVSKVATSSSSNDIVIAVFGMTGSGKSSFISKLTEKDVKIGHGLHSCTSEIEEMQCKIGNYRVTLVDTPGFDDTTRTDTEILRLIASWMKDAYDDKTRLTGVIYLHRISDNKMSGSSYKNLKMFRSLCGTKNLSHVVLATTMWDKVNAEEGAAREAELLSEENWWGHMKSNGSTVKKYDGTTTGATAIVNDLVQMSPVVLKIQDEMAIQKKLLVETQAGRSIDASLRDLSRKHEEDLAEVKADLAKAIKEKDDELQTELEAMKKRLADQIAATNESQRELRRPINQKSWWQWSWTCTKCKAKLTKSRHEPAKADCPGCGFSATFV